MRLGKTASARRSATTVLFAHPSGELYGSDRVLLESVSALVDAGRRVVVTLPVGGPLVAHLRARGAETVICPSPVLRKSALRPAGFAKLIGDVVVGAVRGSALISKERPSLLFVNTVTIPLWILLARLRGLAVLVHVHEGEASASRLVKRVLAFPLLFANRIVANSRFSVGVLAGSFRRFATTTVVYNGVPGPETVDAPREHLDGDLKVAYVGRLSPRKGVDVALDAVARLNDQGIPATLDLVGAVYPGYEWYEEQLREQATKLGIENRVGFSGFRDSVWEAIAGSDIMVVPSRVDEPFGNTAVEAILGGRPVIASATSGLIEATSGYECAETVTPGDPAALASAIAGAAQRWDGVAERIQRDISRANARHAPSVYRSQIADIVERMLQ